MIELTPENIASLRDTIRTALKPRRFEHTLGVMYTAACLGMIWHEDPLRCELAGLLHDCAKNTTDENLISLCQEAGIKLTDNELQSPQIIHAVFGAWLAEHQYQITDPEILDAVRYHTTGRPMMSILEKIIYIADYIEPLRNRSKCLPEARKLAFSDIDRCMLLILTDTIEYLDAAGRPIEENTIAAFKYFKTLCDVQS